jgi:tetratricopeptide (TPR) repeat protein
MESELRRAESLIALHRPEEALAITQFLAATEPGDARPHAMSAFALIEAQRYPEADGEAAKAASLAPEWDWPYRLMAATRLTDALSRTSATDREYIARSGIQAAETAVRLGPFEAANHLTLAQCAAAAKSLVEAMAASDDAIRLAPYSSEAWRVRSVVATAVRDHKLAESAAREALRLQPDSYLANNQLGIALVNRNRGRRATDQFVAAARIDPQRPAARKNAMRNAKLLTYGACLLITAPAAILWPLWLGLAIGLHRLLWWWKPTRSFFERRVVARSQKRSVRVRNLGETRGPVDPGSEFRGPYTVSNLMIVWLVILDVLLLVLIGTASVKTGEKNLGGGLLFFLAFLAFIAAGVYLTRIFIRRQRRSLVVGERSATEGQP